MLAPGLAHWFDRDGDTDRGLVAYRDTGRAWVAAGEPIATRDEAALVAERFVDAAIASRRRVAFFATEGTLASSPRFRRILIGEQPTWNPMQWDAHVRSHRSFREQLRRARKKGVAVEHVDREALEDPRSPPRVELDALVRRWLAMRPMPAMHFLVEVAPFVHVKMRRVFVATRDGSPVALLSLAPVAARDGWLFEHLLRDPSAPNGTAEMLVDCAMHELARHNNAWATLGLAPLAGPVDGWLRAARTLARPFFNFAGLAAFKRKLRPDAWEPIYLAYPRERSSFWAMRDGLRAFAGGSLIAFAVRTALRGPAPLLRLLERALLPWTLALAIAPVSPWFPSRSVQAGWVAFDVALLISLRALRRRWSLPLAVAVASSVSLDTLLTGWQAITWNWPRVQSAFDAAVVIVACAGPALSAVVLWGAVRRMRIAQAMRKPSRIHYVPDDIRRKQHNR